MDYITLARQLRLATITNLCDNGYLGINQARELLRGPLVPDDPSTVYDDSELLGDPEGLENIGES
jgi:hypothetical protein